MTDAAVVGVGGFPSSFEAVGTAAREAESRGTALRLVHAFEWPTPNGRRTERPQAWRPPTTSRWVSL